MRLRELRDARGMTVDDLLLKLNKQGVELSIWTLYKYEQGELQVGLDLLPALAKALGCKSIAELLPTK